MLNSKLDTRRDAGEQRIGGSATRSELRPSKSITAFIVGFLSRLNPVNWFNDFRDIEITIEEDSIKKD